MSPYLQEGFLSVPKYVYMPMHRELPLFKTFKVYRYLPGPQHLASHEGKGVLGGLQLQLLQSCPHSFNYSQTSQRLQFAKCGTAGFAAHSWQQHHGDQSLLPQCHLQFCSPCFSSSPSTDPECFVGPVHNFVQVCITCQSLIQCETKVFHFSGQQFHFTMRDWFLKAYDPSKIQLVVSLLQRGLMYCTKGCMALGL